MSIEAIAYAKTLDVDKPALRLLLIIIGENTFNDTGLCKVSQAVLAKDTRAKERSLRDQLAKLRYGGFIKRQVRPKREGGRLCDAIELVGFLEWLEKAQKAEPAKTAVSPVPEPADRLPVRYKDKSPVLKTPVLSENAETSFDAFWEIYPRKVGKVNARKAFEKAREQGLATGAELVKAVRRYAASRAKQDPKFTLHPATWLNGQRWFDDPEPAGSRQLQAAIYDAGPSYRNTDETFAEYAERMKREGKWRPAA